jgi:peroxiredoxin family protein
MNTMLQENNQQLDQDTLDNWFDERLERRLTERDDAKVPSITIIATKGDLDMAYPPFILAATAAAMGWDATILCAFYGLGLLKKKLNLKISPIGSPAMPMKSPYGPKWFQNINMPMPNALMSNLPGFESMATAMMKKGFKNTGVASIEDLREACIESGVKLKACPMTMELFGWKQEDMIPEISEWMGAGAVLPIAQKSDVTLFV